MDTLPKRLLPIGAWMVGLAFVSAAFDLLLLTEEIIFSPRHRMLHLGVPELAILLTFHSLQLIGGIHMRTQNSYSFAYSAAVTCCVPFLSPLLIFGIPLGFWAIHVLNEPESIDGFRTK